MSDDDSTGVPHFLDDVQLIERKRVRLDSAGNKRWSLADRHSDNEVMEEMGVGLLGQEGCDSLAGSSTSAMVKGESKRKRDIENVSPNVIVRSPARAKVSPRRARSKHSPAGESNRPDGHVLSERSVNETCDPSEEETPLPLLPAHSLHSKRTAQASPIACSSTESSGYTAGSRERLSMVSSNSYSTQDAMSPISNEDSSQSDFPSKKNKQLKNLFVGVSDEVILQIFKWLPKRSLVRCTLVCRRWHRIASDESLWQRLELGEKVLTRGALGLILAKKPVVVRLASAEVGEWTQSLPSPRLQYLDLSMCSIQLATLNALIPCCPNLKRLSLESVEVDRQTCEAIGNCPRLETLNMAMTTGLESEGLKLLLNGCTYLQSLNVSWCKLDSDSARAVCENAPRGLQRLTLAGCKTLTTNLLERLVCHCRKLQELDLSDCSALTKLTLSICSKLPKLEHLAISRCYHLDPLDVQVIEKMPSLQYLDVWGMLAASSLGALRSKLNSVSVNQFMLSAIARPTVGPRRTSIWGIRTRD